VSLTLPLLAGTCRSPIPNLRAPATAPRQDFPGDRLIMLAQGRDFEAERLKCLLRLVHAALSGRFQTGPVKVSGGHEWAGVLAVPHGSQHTELLLLADPTDRHWLPLDPARSGLGPGTLVAGCLAPEDQAYPGKSFT
jgi:hypothetical protein